MANVNWRGSQGSAYALAASLPYFFSCLRLKSRLLHPRLQASRLPLGLSGRP
jgi:hypothetical protein